MSLQNILLDISSILGLDISDPAQRAYWIEQINFAANELYTSQDLPGSMREQIFQLNDVDNYQASFPWYVDKIRAMRFYNTWGGKLSMEDIRPRYHSNRWGMNGLLKFRIKRADSVFATHITNEGPITFSFAEGRTEITDTIVHIVGKTVESDKVTESVTILAGQNSAVSVKSYESVETIEKANYTTYDILMFDIDSRELGRIPNSELNPRYTIVQIRQDDFAPVYHNSYPLNTVEVLYKTRFTPFRNLRDQFTCPNMDKIIFWKFAEHYAAYKPGMEQRAIMAAGKVKALLQELNVDDESGKEITVEFGPNGMFDSQITKNPIPVPYGVNYPFIEYTL